MFRTIAGRLAAAAVLSVSLVACGGSAEDTAEGSLESAATLAAPSGTFRVKDRGTRNTARTLLTFQSWLDGAHSTESSLGTDGFETTRAARGGRVDWSFDQAGLAAALAGAQPHLLSDSDEGVRRFSSFDVTVTVKASQGALKLRDSALRTGDKAELVLVLEAAVDPQTITAAAGDVKRVAGLPRFLQWHLSMADVAKTVLAGKTLSVKTKVGTRTTSTAFTFTVAAERPTVLDVPGDFDLSLATLAEDPARKIGIDGASGATLDALHAIADALRDDPDTNLNIAAIFASPAGLTVAQGNGALVPGHGTRTESWWLSRAALERAVNRATRGLPVRVVDEGER